jgi:hypothetical protein
MRSGPNRSRTGDFGMNGYGVLQSYTLPLSYRPRFVDAETGRFLVYIVHTKVLRWSTMLVDQFRKKYA